MVSVEEVMLPYMLADDGRTLFELYAGSALPQLEAATA